MIDNILLPEKRGKKDKKMYVFFFRPTRIIITASYEENGGKNNISTRLEVHDFDAVLVHF